ncbi:MAG: hypothetical protein K5753_03620 [Clostridia bacterium]|nr:hypothetical protein [Clostridia bacterium]
MNNRTREKVLFIVLLSIAAAAFVCFSVLTALAIAGAEKGAYILPLSVVLWSGVASSLAILAIGAVFLVRLLKSKK